MQEDVWRADKLLLLSGTTGAGVREAFNRIASRLPAGACAFHYEDIVLEDRRLGGAVDIEQVASLTVVARPTARRLFWEAVEKIRERARRRGCRKLVVAAHISYLARRTLITNPALGSLLDLAREVTIVYLLEDYYDILDTVARRYARTRRVRKSIVLDPILVLQWRGADFNLLAAIESFKPGTETLILGVKHPVETLDRLARDALQTRREALEHGSYTRAYVSHPISEYRRLYALYGGRSLSSLPFVAAVEAAKRVLLEENPSLILFEPTTVDELLEDSIGRLMEVLGSVKLPKELEPLELKVKQQSVGDTRDSSGGRPNGDNQDTPKPRAVYHSLFVDPANRWPLPPQTIREAEGHRYRHREGRLNILEDRLLLVYHVGDPNTAAAMVFDLLANNPPPGPGEDTLKGMLQAQIIDYARHQIEMRDYYYVAQSHMIIALNTPTIIVEDGEYKAYLPTSTGMEAEIHRARALARPVTYILLPVSWEAVERSLADSEGAFNHVISRWRPCGKANDPEKAVDKCTIKIAEGSILGAVGPDVRPITVAYTVTPEATLETLLEAYRERLAPILGK